MTIEESYNNLRKYCVNAENKIFFLRLKYGEDPGITYSYVTMFQKFGDHEKVYKKDVSNFTEHQLIGAFECSCSTVSLFQEQYRMLKHYFKFCGKKIPDISFEDLNIIGNIGDKFVRNFEEFDMILDEVFGSEFDNTINSMRRACLYLFYLGVKRSSALTILKEDIDDHNNSVYISAEKRYVDAYTKIPDRCMELFRKCKYMTTYHSLNPTYDADSSERPLQDTKYLIRGDATTYVSDACPRHFVEKIFQLKEFKALNRRLNAVSIYNSGLYAWLYEQECKGRFDDMTRPKDFRSILSEYVGIEKKNSESYRHDYKNWKKVFEL